MSNAREIADLGTVFDADGDATIARNLDVSSGTIKLDGNYPVGSNNVALGNQALDDGSLTGGNNTAIGASALTANTTGFQNTAVGKSALASNTTARDNVAVGMLALEDNTTGDYNTAVGSGALTDNTTGYYNTATGTSALLFNTTGHSNTATGLNALFSNTTGERNTAVGTQAGDSVTTAVAGTFVGYQAGAGITTGGSNTFVGADSGELVTTGANNTIIGRYNGNQDSLDIRTASNRIVVSDGDGNIGMYIDGSQDAHFDGDVIAYSTTISDRRLKDDIENITDALDKVEQINGVTFVRKNNGQASAGVIAQEIMEVLPEAVKEKSMPIQTGTEDTYYVVEYDAVTGLLVEAVKELKARVEALEAK